jgi:hypothetical protein
MLSEDTTAGGSKSVEITGQLVRRLAWAPVRVLMVITGLILIRGLIALVVRYLLVLRRRATATVDRGTLTLDVEWSLFGRRIRSTRTSAPIRDLETVRFENRRLYVHLLIGFGCLVVGIWLGIQWLVDGLRAGYPYLALIGAGVVAAGVVIDLVLYLVVPETKGRNRVILAMGPWKLTLAGVDARDGERFIEAARSSWRGAAESRE